MILAADRPPLILMFNAGISIICQGGNPWRALAERHPDGYHSGCTD